MKKPGPLHGAEGEAGGRVLRVGPELVKTLDELGVLLAGNLGHGGQECQTA
jgi:hypothetical protein